MPPTNLLSLARRMVPSGIRARLSLIVTGLLGAALLLVFVGNAWISVSNQLHDERVSLQLLADATSHNLEASLMFRDSKGSQEVLDGLVADPKIVRATVRDAEQNVVATYRSEMALAPMHRADDAQWVARTLTVQRAVIHSPLTIGTLEVQSSLDQMWQTLMSQLGQMAAIVAAVMLCGVVLIRRVARAMVNPMLQIAATARAITQNHDYALRVDGSGANEVGDMAMALNLMLSEIETRNQALRVAAVAFESQEGMYVTDEACVIMRVNRSFTQITGYSPEEAVGKTPCELNPAFSHAGFYQRMWDQLKADGSWQGEVHNRRKSGQDYPEWLTITAVKTPQGEVSNYVAAFTDITERKASEEEIARLAYYDPLTQLPNRRLLMERLQQALGSLDRNDGDGALLFIDMDNFKNLNDTLGHGVGDLLLQQVAERLSHCVRKHDTVARLGGDEFVVMLVNLSNDPATAATQAQVATDKILAQLNQTYQLAQHTWLSTPSIGVARFATGKVSADELMRRADVAMYQAKKSGRNRACFYE